MRTKVPVGRALLNGLRVACLAALYMGTSAAAPIPGDYSDIAKIAANAYLVVFDQKTPRDAGERLAVITVSSGEKISVEALPVPAWGDVAKAPSDLEACCVVPAADGRRFSDEVLVFESGVYQNRFGRVFHLRLSSRPDGRWDATLLGAFTLDTKRPLEMEKDDPATKTTYPGYNIEGAACFRGSNALILVYGERGGRTESGSKVGTIVWGELDLRKYTFSRIDEARLVSTPLLNDRDCSALYLKKEGAALAVLSVATYDPDTKLGPFESIVYRAGTLEVKGAQITFTAHTAPLHRIAGLKVEGVAEAPDDLKERSDLCVVSDDEKLGGAWRLLPRVRTP